MRPKGWDKIKQKIIAETLQRDIVEATADAVLEGLKRDGLLSTATLGEGIDWGLMHNGKKGHIVFIEE